MSRTVADAVNELCLSFPGTEEKPSHGMPAYRVAGKAFAYYLRNHHGDGRVALWLGVDAQTQQTCTELNPRAYFIPPYVGPKGWLGVELNKGLAWEEICERVRDAYLNTSPGKPGSRLPEIIDIEPPDVELSPEDVNPFLGAYPSEVFSRIRELCRRLPETSAGSEDDSTWKAGSKVFFRSRHEAGRLKLLFWTGIEMQSFLVEDPRYAIPMYIGGGGWTELDVQDGVNWEEVGSLLENSYRHFALKRMLKALDG